MPVTGGKEKAKSKISNLQSTIFNESPTRSLTTTLIPLLILAFLLLTTCSKKTPTSADERTVPRQGRWGIYALNLTTEAVEAWPAGAISES